MMGRKMNDWTIAAFSDMLDYEQPNKYIVDSTEYSDLYKTPVLTAGKSFIKGYTNEKNNIFDKVPVIIFDDFTTASQWVNFNFKVKSSAMKILHPTCSLVNMKFMYYCMQVNKVRSDTHKRYWISIFAPKEFNLPSLPEQRAIVAKIEELFSSLDNGIENLEKAKEQLKVYRQAVLKKAFEGELTKEWREMQTDLPSSVELLQQIKRERENYYNQQIAEWETKVKEWEQYGKEGKKPGKPKAIKQLHNPSEEEIESLSSLPSIWVYNYLAYAGKLARGKSKHRPRNDKRLFDGKYPFIQTGEVKAVDRITSFSKTYNEFGLSQSELWPCGTLCITIAANIAETAFLDIEACFPDSIVGYHPFTAVVDKQYVNYFFHSAKARLSAYAPATAQKNINLNTLENLLFPFCSVKEQNQIVLEIESRLSVCDKVEESISEGLLKANALKQSILKKAIDGALLSEVELESCRQETDWEPAAVLLERIKSEKK